MVFFGIKPFQTGLTDLLATSSEGGTAKAGRYSIHHQRTSFLLRLVSTSKLSISFRRCLVSAVPNVSICGRPQILARGCHNKLEF